MVSSKQGKIAFGDLVGILIIIFAARYEEGNCFFVPLSPLPHKKGKVKGSTFGHLFDVV